MHSQVGLKRAEVCKSILLVGQRDVHTVFRGAGEGDAHALHGSAEFRRHLRHCIGRPAGASLRARTNCAARDSVSLAIGNLVEGRQLAGDSIAVGDVHCLGSLERSEHIFCWRGVVPLAV
jgi:hypothetical protein